MTIQATTLAVLTLLAAAQATPPAAPQQEPRATFKTSVELVPVDVNVVDREGRPLATLKAADFALAVDGKPRKIASAEFIAVTREVERAPVQPADYSSNAAATGGRLIMLVVDQGNIGTSRGKFALESASRFISRLQKSDRVGLTTVPGAGPQVDFTSNHAVVQNVLRTLIGQGDLPTPQNENIGVTEAIELQRGNEQLIQKIVDRECLGFSGDNDPSGGTCRMRLLNEARRLYAELRSRTRDTLISLHRLMDQLSRTQAPKTVVFVSEGIVLEQQSSEVSWMAPLTSRGQISLYVLQLQPPHLDAGNQRVSPSRSEDIEFAQDGLAYLAGLARGAVFRVVAGADRAFTQLATELSGYYLLSFEPEPGDRDGKVHKIKISVPGRKDVAIRSRVEFSVDAARVLSTQELLAEAIVAPLMLNDIGLRLATYSFTESEPGRLRVVLAAEIDRTTNDGARVALAYAVTDAANKLVSTQVEPNVTTLVMRDTKVQTYLGAIAVPPGDYIAKVAVVDDAGRRGSVEHRFRAKLTSAGQIRITDLLLGDDSGGASVTPTASAEFRGTLLHGYVELQSEAPEPLKNAAVALEVAAGEQARAIDSAEATFQDEASPTPSRRAAEATVPIALLPPGDYVARAVVTVAGQRVGQVSRPFRIVRSGLAATAAGSETPATAGGGRTLIPFTSRIDAFERSSVLTPQVVGFFLDRMNTANAGVTPPAALQSARAGRFEEAVAAASAAGNSKLAPVFLGGLASYAKGELEVAAGKFRESLRIDSEFFPAAFYLGACYAAGGKDREAAGAWQTALITESDAPFIYTLLGDAFLRLHDVDQALDILKEATTLWPGNEQVQLRLGTAYSEADKPVEAVRALDPYLATHPEDQERLFVALKSIYRARSTGQGIGSAEEDRARFQRYAEAYAAAGGTQQALVEQWKRFIVR